MVSNSGNVTKDHDAKSDQEARDDTAERTKERETGSPIKERKCNGGLETRKKRKKAPVEHQSAREKEVLSLKVASTSSASIGKMKPIDSPEDITPIPDPGTTALSLTDTESTATTNAYEEEPGMATATSVFILKPILQSKIISVRTLDSSSATDSPCTPESSLSDSTSSSAADSSSSDDTSSSADESITTLSDHLPEAALNIPEQNLPQSEGPSRSLTPGPYTMLLTPNPPLPIPEAQRGKALRKISGEVKEKSGRLKRTASLKLENAKCEFKNSIL